MGKTRSKHYGRYSSEFKRLAVLLSYHPDIKGTEIADKLRIHPIMLYRWRLEMKKSKIPHKTTSHDFKGEVDLLQANKEIDRLKAKLKEVERERDFLKKAKRFFQGKNVTSSHS
jgi:transposase